MAGVSNGGHFSPPRQPEDRQEYRKSLHKSSCSPHWKGAYREVGINRSSSTIHLSLSHTHSTAVQEETEGKS